MAEYFDIYDADLRHIGIAERSDVHRMGYWHQTFHCWITRMEGNRLLILLQRRHPEKDTNPGMYDVSVAGHLSAGEQELEGVREMEEELGLVVSPADLKKVGDIRDPYQQGAVIDNEYAHVYWYGDGLPLEEYRPLISEVAGIYELPFDSFAALVQGRAAFVSATGYEVKTSETEGYSLMPKVVTIDGHDLVPRTDDYYSMLLNAIGGWG